MVGYKCGSNLKNKLERRSRGGKKKFSDLVERRCKNTYDIEAGDRVGVAHKVGWRERMFKENLTKYTIFENAIMIPSTL